MTHEWALEKVAGVKQLLAGEFVPNSPTSKVLEQSTSIRLNDCTDLAWQPPQFPPTNVTLDKLACLSRGFLEDNKRLMITSITRVAVRTG